MFDFENFDQILGLQKSDRLLLKNLLDDKNKDTTVNDFCREFDLWNIDYEQFALMPLFYVHNENIKYSNNLRIRIRGIYNYLMCKNSSNLKLALNLIKALNQEGIKVLLLKGIVLCHSYYKSLALRRMEDIDIAVLPKDYEKAVKIAYKLGWKGEKALHSIDLKKDTVGAVDLHELIYKENFSHKEIEKELWEDLTRISFYGEEVYIMTDEDMFISVLINEFLDILAMPKGSKKIKWILDITRIIENSDNLDHSKIYQKIKLFGFQPQIICLLKAYINICGNKYKIIEKLLDLMNKEQEIEFNLKRLKVFNELYESYRHEKIINYDRTLLLFQYLCPYTYKYNIVEFKNFLYLNQNVDSFEKLVKKNFAKYLKRIGGMTNDR